MSNFITQVDFSTQVKEYQNTDAVLSGSVSVQQYTVLGTDYSDLPLGLDNTTTGITNTITPVTNGYFTGTTVSTTFYFSDSNMDIGIPYISAITNSNSGITQNIEAYQPISTIIVDGNSFDIYFSGVSYNLTPINVLEYTPGEFSGDTFTNVLTYLSGSTYPWWFLKSGSTTWNEVKGRIKTDRLTVVDGAINGYVLTSDNDGNATWQPSSGGGSFTGGSGNCITDLYVTNIHGCSPIIIHDILSGNSTINYIDLSTNPTQLQIRNDSFGNGSYLDFDSGTYYGTKLGNGPFSYLGFSFNVGTIYSSSQINLFSNNLSYTQQTDYGSAFLIGGGSGKNFVVKTNDSSGQIFNSNITGGSLQGEIVMGIPNTNIGLPLGVMGTGLGVNTTPYGVVGKDFDPVFISTPRSRSYDNSSYSSIKNILFGGGSDNSVLSGVTNSSLIGGSGNTINNNIKNAVILGGEGITANTNNTVYVPDLVIKKFTSTPTTSGDTIGEVGSVTWDNNYIYVKTISGWGRTLLDYSF